MGRTGTLHILHTNDIHSHFEQIPHIASCLKHHRTQFANRGEHVLTVDIGDHADRARLQTEATWGRVNVEIMNRCGYQYATIGNNEGITLPHQQLEQLYDHASFKVVVGNLIDPHSMGTPDWALPYAIHQWEGWSMAILGVTAAFYDSYNILGWKMEDPLAVVAKQVAMLRQEVQSIVVLSHLGYTLDVEMARQIEGIDVILGGHTHRLLEHGERVGSTLITQAGSFGKHIGHVRCTVDLETKRIIRTDAEVYAVQLYRADREMATFLAREQSAAEQQMGQTVAVLSQAMRKEWFQESLFGSFLAASLRKWTGAEIGMANSGLLLRSLPAGPITRKDMLETAPHPIKPALVTLTGKQLRNVLQRTVQPELVYKELRGFGFRGKVLGWMCLDNVDVSFAKKQKAADWKITVSGKPLKDEETYTLGVPDMFLYHPLFPEFQMAANVRLFPEVLREVLAQTISNAALLQASRNPRWHLK